jgi:putative heme-binding domain-containing protein
LLPEITSKQVDLPGELVSNLLVTLRDEGVDIVERYGSVFAEGDRDFAAQMKLAGNFTEALGSDRSEKIAQMFRPLYAQAVQTANATQADEQSRCEALQLVGIGIESSPHDAAMLLDLLAPSTPLSVQQAAIDRLADFADVATIALLLEKWPSMSKAVRDHCVSYLLQRSAWTETLLGALERGSIRVTDLSPAVQQQLTHTGSRSMQVRAQRLTHISGSVEKQTLIASYLAANQGSGDPVRGAQVFKQHCAVCHQANLDGQAIGASLNNLTDRSPQALLVAILDPNRAVDPKYLSYVLRTQDDRLLVGMIEDETGQSLTLAHADGKRTTLRRVDIVEMKNSGVSLMPEGLQSAIPPESMQDLIRYLQTMPEANH